MPIQISPVLQDELEDRILRLTAENIQLTQAIATAQDRITGAAPPPPGLTLEDDVNLDLQTQLDAAVDFFEDERRALDGAYPNPQVVPADIEAAANNQRPNALYPTGNIGLDPTFINPLQGLGGADANNESVRKVTELADLTTLLGLALVLRATDPAYTTWVASLTAQSALLATQIAAASANLDYYGPAHPDVIAAQSEKNAIDALLPAPAVDNATLLGRQAQALARQAFIPTRIATLLSDVTPLYGQRYLVIQSRVHTAKGTRSMILNTQKTITLFQGFIVLNNDLIAFYNSVLP
jgi:hypothetical protein